MQRQTTIAKAQDIERKWFVIDATDLPLGRLASEIAVRLTGKNKPIYTPNVDCGDYIIVVNADKVGLSGDTNSQIVLADSLFANANIHYLFYSSKFFRSFL